MKRWFFFIIFFGCIACNVFAQVKLYEDQFNGGVTGGSFSTGVSGSGNGVITLHIDPSSTIRKAYLIVGRLGPAPAMTVNLNSMVLVFDASNQATPDFMCSLYGGLSAVHAIDITSQVNPAVNTYNIDYSQGGSGANFFTDFYLYVAYENIAMPLVNTVIFLKTTDFIVTEQYTLNLANPVDTLVDVGFAMDGGYMCSSGFDGENITVASVLLGNIGGGDPNNPPNVCSGTSGSFYYENNILYGLQGDNPNQAMASADALSNVRNILPNGAVTFDVQFEHFGGFGFPADNSMWAWIMAYGNSNVQPTAVFSSPNHICPGTCTDFTNLSVNANTFNWSFPGASPDFSTDINPLGICYHLPGQYDVTLIATNSNGSDTLTLPNYITVYPFPAPQGILQSGDTLIANSGAVGYQWYLNGNLIAGATNSFYVATQSGNYNVVATDANGCEVEAAIYDVIAEIQLAVSNSQLAIFPNPVIDKFKIHSRWLSGSKVKSGTAVEISIYNVMGEQVLVEQRSFVAGKDIEINCGFLPAGLYMLEIKSDERRFVTKFTKQ